MTIHQNVRRWWQRYVAGELTTPRQLHAAALSEVVAGDAVLHDRFFEPALDGLFFDAPARLAAPGFILSGPMLRQWDRADWRGCDPRLMRWSALFQEAARKRGIPLYVHCALRGPADQAKAVSEGNSRLPYPQSAHNIGEAVDIVHGVYHWLLTKQEWQFLHKVGLECLDRVNAGRPAALKLRLVWGGSWSSPYDPAHWEIADFHKRVRVLPPLPPVRLTPRAILRDYK